MKTFMILLFHRSHHLTQRYVPTIDNTIPHAFEADSRLPKHSTPTNVARTVLTPPLTVFGNPGFGPRWMHRAIHVCATRATRIGQTISQQTLVVKAGLRAVHT